MRTHINHVIALAAKLPAASMLIPMLVGAAVTTWCPWLEHLGPFGDALSGDSTAYIAVLMIAVGAQIQPAQLRPVGRRVGIVLVTATLLPGIGVAAYGMIFGPAGVAGVSALAAAATLCTSNGLWITLGHRFAGADDAYAGAVVSILNSGPLFPLLLLMLWGTGKATVPWASLADAVLPLLGGFAAAMLYPAFRTWSQRLIAGMIVALSFSLGCRINLTELAGGPMLTAGAVLGLASGLLVGTLTAIAWVRLLRQPSTAGWIAAALTVGAGVVPDMVAHAEPRWRPYAAAATTQITVAVVVSTLLATALTALAAWRHRDRSATTDTESLTSAETSAAAQVTPTVPASAA